MIPSREERPERASPASRPLLALVGLLCLASGAGAQGPAAPSEDDKTVSAEVELVTEHDDNVGLRSGAGPGEEVRGDTVVRARPRLRLRHAVRDHRFTADVSGDLRRGLRTDLEDSNALASGSAALAWPGGISLNFFESYQRTTFDQAILFGDNVTGSEAGVSQVNANAAGAAAIFSPVDRFRVEGSYERRDEAYDFGRVAAGAEPSDSRDIDILAARIGVPVARPAIAYAAARYTRQDTEHRIQYRYDSIRTVGGIRIQGPARFLFYAEGGRGEADYEDAPGVEFEETVYEAGFEANVSDETVVRGSVGRNLYGKPTYEALASHRRKDDVLVSLLLRRTTETSFSGRTVSRLFDATVLRGRLEKQLGQRVGLGFEASLLDVAARAARIEQDDRTWTLLGRLDYAVRRWARLGGEYRYARRTSTLRTTEFDDNRIGAFLRLVY